MIRTLKSFFAEDSPYSYKIFENNEVFWLKLKKGQKKEAVVAFWETISELTDIHSDLENPQKIFENANIEIKISKKGLAEPLVINMGSYADEAWVSTIYPDPIKKAGDKVFLQIYFFLNLRDDFEKTFNVFQEYDVELDSKEKEKRQARVVASVPVENIVEIAFFDPYFFLHDPDDGDFYEAVENPWDHRI